MDVEQVLEAFLDGLGYKIETIVHEWDGCGQPHNPITAKTIVPKDGVTDIFYIIHNLEKEVLRLKDELEELKRVNSPND